MTVGRDGVYDTCAGVGNSVDQTGRVMRYRSVGGAMDSSPTDRTAASIGERSERQKTIRVNPRVSI